MLTVVTCSKHMVSAWHHQLVNFRTGPLLAF